MCFLLREEGSSVDTGIVIFVALRDWGFAVQFQGFFEIYSVVSIWFLLWIRYAIVIVLDFTCLQRLDVILRSNGNFTPHLQNEES